MRIDNHLLTGDNIFQKESPNRSGGYTPKYLIFHYTAGRNFESSVNYLCKPEAKASAHLVLGRNGRIAQLVPFNKVAWHAGRSHWEGISGLNRHSIGIEIDNAGPLTKRGNTFRAWFGANYPEEEVIHAKHKLDSAPAYWHTYTDTQIKRAMALAELLVRAYNLTDILGHEDIAPERKRDPGPAFPLESIRSRILGRDQEEDERFRVTASALNIRRGPGVEFDTVAQALKRGTLVFMLEKRDRWSRVDVEGDNDVEGWVANKFLEPA